MKFRLDLAVPACPPLNRRQWVALGLAALAVPAARADSYPSGPIRLVVPFPAGGPTDIVARALAVPLDAALAQRVIVDNRGGAGGSIGAGVVAHAAPDGYTLLVGTVGTAAINRALYKTLAYDPVADFTPIGTLASAPIAIVAAADSGTASLKDLVAKAKAHPGELTYGSAGNGTPGHLAGAMFCAAAGIKLQHVPYKGSAPALTDLMGGRLNAMFDPLQSVLAQVKGGKLTGLAVASRERAAVLPAVPTVAESGWPGYEFTAWWAAYAPAKLPADVAARLQAEIARIVRSPAYRQHLGELGLLALDVPLAAFQKTETDKWSAAVRSSGVTIE